MRIWVSLALGLVLLSCGKEEKPAGPAPVDVRLRVESRVEYHPYDTVAYHRILILGADMDGEAHGIINGIEIPPDSFEPMELLVGLAAYVEDSTLSEGDTVHLELDFRALVDTPVHVEAENIVLSVVDTIFFYRNSGILNIIWNPVDGADAYKVHLESNCYDTSWQWYRIDTVFVLENPGISIADSLICPYDTINSGSLGIRVYVYNGPWNSPEGNVEGAQGRFFTITSRLFQFSLPLR